MRITLFANLFLIFFLSSCDEETKVSPILQSIESENKNLVQGTLMPLGKATIQGSGFSTLTDIILDGKVSVPFNTSLVSDNTIILDVPYEESIGSRFGNQTLKLITQYGEVETNITMFQPLPVVNSYKKTPKGVKIEGNWYYNITEIKYNGLPIKYERISGREMYVDIPLTPFVEADLEITNNLGVTKKYIDQSLLFDIVTISDFDSPFDKVKRHHKGWYTFGDAKSFDTQIANGPTGKYANLVWEAKGTIDPITMIVQPIGFNGISGGDKAHKNNDEKEADPSAFFSNSKFTDPSLAFIDIDLSGVKITQVSIQLNNIDGKDFGYVINLNGVNWKTYTIKLSDFKDGYGFGSLVPGGPNPIKVTEIKVGIQNPITGSIVNFDNIKIKYKLP